jgi:DNA-binding transcriptional LysR family regulator
VEPAGRLAVGVSIAGHRDHWFDLGEGFTARYPRVDVEIHTALSELLQRQVVAGGLDVAIVLEPNRLPGLRYQHVRTEPLLVWMHAAHPLADRAELSAADLGGVAVTLMGGSAGRTSGFNARIRQLFADAGVTPAYAEAPNVVPSNAMRVPDALTLPRSALDPRRRRAYVGRHELRANLHHSGHGRPDPRPLAQRPQLGPLGPALSAARPQRDREKLARDGPRHRRSARRHLRI